jgi:glycosyltransferase involved in cell wall biosynthesis
MKISLIITTYNWEPALELSLLTILRQSRMPDEVVIADDGSNEGTRHLVEAMAALSPVPFFHVWQRDRGFRAAQIRNKAIASATGDYLVIMDGDIVAHPDFIRDHEQAARPGCFCQGSRVLLTRAKTERVLKEKQLHFSPFERGFENRKNSIRSQLLSVLFATRQRRLTGIRTCNFALWKDDVLAVNGFNEDFEGWGREDSEFAVRLMNRGISRRNLKFAARAYHLYHPEHPKTSLERNDGILEQAIKERASWCRNGIDKYVQPSGAAQ